MQSSMQSYLAASSLLLARCSVLTLDAANVNQPTDGMNARITDKILKSTCSYSPNQPGCVSNLAHPSSPSFTHTNKKKKNSGSANQVGKALTRHQWQRACPYGPIGSSAREKN